MPRKQRTGPATYIPKPAPVQAMRVEQPYKAITEWCGWEPVKIGPKVRYFVPPEGGLGAVQRAFPGDYIVLDRTGEFSSRKADDFEKHYLQCLDEPPSTSLYPF